MLSLAGAQRQLFPAPEAVGDDVLWLVEGEPDALSVLSLGLSAVAVPGAQAWRAEYALRFVGRDVVVCCDCDEPGRALAAQAAGDLLGFASSVRVIDLDASRTDGYDVGDLIRKAAAHGAAGLIDARYLLATMAEHAQPVVVDLADPHPPAPPSDLGELLQAIVAFVRRYVVLPGEHEATALALFILHTWAIDGAHATPYLLVISPEKRSGKTRLLEVLALLVRAPWHTNSTSEAALFRKIEQATPTLLLDEIDAIFGSSSERTEPLRAVLNSGNRRGVTVTRCVGKSHEVAEFSVFCPKVLAGINKDRRLPETIRDRAIPIRMRRRHDAEPVERFRERKARELATPLRDQARAWAGAVTDGLLEAEPNLPGALGDRAGDAWEPLFAIADLAGGTWPTRARNAAVALSGVGEPDEASFGALLLAKLKTLLAGCDAITTANAVAAINADDELPFGGWNRRNGLDGRTLAKLLKPYQLNPRPLKVDGKTVRGYRARDLEDAWRRYLPPDPQPPQPSATSPLSPPADTTPSSAGAPDPQPGNPDRHLEVVEVAEVADRPNVTSAGWRQQTSPSATGPVRIRSSIEPGTRAYPVVSGRASVSSPLDADREPVEHSHDPLCAHAEHIGRSWRTVDGRIVCAVCHPPAHPSLICTRMGESERARFA